MKLMSCRRKLTNKNTEKINKLDPHNNYHFFKDRKNGEIKQHKQF